MANGDITFFNSAKAKIGDGSIDWDTHSFKVALINGSVNIDTNDAWDDLSGSETSNGSGYTTGGVAITPSAPTVDTTNDWAEFDATDAAWTNLGARTITHGILYKDSGTPSTSWLVCYIELTTQPNGGNYTIAWHADGVFKVV